MPSPFPGMDPFLESQEWEDFHSRMITALSDRLSPGVQPDYVVRVERRIYVERPEEDTDTFRRADVAILAMDSGPATGLLETTDSSAFAVECELPMPVERQETYLVVRERESMEVVTVIELLSPANKRPRSDGRREYLSKRNEFLSSSSHLVELDFLRGGKRLPVIGSLPPGDFYAIVSRAYRRPRCSVYAWTLKNKLPTIPIPLKRSDVDAQVALQEVFDIVWQRARYDLSVIYRISPDPPFNAIETEWAKTLLLAE